MTVGLRSLEMTVGLRSLEMTVGLRSLEMTVGLRSLEMTVGHIICSAYPGTKIRNLSDIFIIFASWTNKTFSNIKKALNILWKTFVTLTILLLTSLLLLQTPMVQTFIANKVLENLSEHIDGNISFEKIHFKPFSTLVLKNVVITDKHPYTDPSDPTCQRVDTLLKARYLIADFSLKSLIAHEGIRLDGVLVEDTQMNLVLEPDRKGDGTTTNLTRILKLDELEEKEKTDKELFRIKHAEAHNLKFVMKNYTDSKTEFYGGINWNDLQVDNIEFEADDIRLKGEVMSADINRLSFNEKSGYICNELTGRVRVGNGLAHISDARLVDHWSELNMPYFKLMYTGAEDFSDYINKVIMEAEINESLIDFKSISYFAPQLEGNQLKLRGYQGYFYGIVNDFMVDGLKVEMEGGGLTGTISGRMTGIPDVMKTSLDGHITDCMVTSRGLSRFVSYWMDGEKLDLSWIAPGEKFRIEGAVSGTLNNMTVQPVITSGIGSATGKDIRIDDILMEGKPLRISGNLHTDNVDVGKIIGNEIVGPVTLSVNAEATFGDQDSPIKASISDLKIDRLHFHGYDYTGISGEAVISDKFVDGKLTCDDPALTFMTHGRYGISRKNQDTKYDFAVLVGDADLNKLNIDRRGKSKTRFKMRADFTQTSSNDIFGTISVNGLMLENEQGSYDIGDISLNSINRANTTYKMELTSSFAQGNLTGTAPVTDFVKDLLGVTLKRELPALFNDNTYTWNGNRYKLDFDFKNTQDILAWALPGLYIADGTKLNAEINDRGRFNMVLNSQRIAYNGNYIKDLEMNLNNNDDTCSGEVSGTELKISTLKLMDNNVKVLADNDHIGMAYRYENSSELENRGEFILHGDLSRDEQGLAIDVKLLPSTLYLNSREWRIRESWLTLHRDGIKSSDIELFSDDQKIRLHGGTSQAKIDTLSLDMEKFDMSVINPLFKTDLGIKGYTSGTVHLTSPMTDKGILVDVVCDSAYFADCRIGRMSASSVWDEEFKRFNINAETEIDGRKSIELTAKFTPMTKGVLAHAKLNRLHVGYLQPLMTDVFSDLQGYVTGELMAEGPIDNLTWDSRDARLEDGRLRVDFTNVQYFVDGEFRFCSEGLFFENAKGRDRYDGTADITGGITWNNKFQNIYYDVTINCEQMEGIDLNSKQNEYFFGNVFGTGTVTFTGPDSDMLMNVEGTTAKKGTFHVPIIYTSVSGRSNLLKFTEIKEEKHIDPYDLILEKFESKNTTESKFTAKMKIDAQPDVDATIWFDQTSGHMLSGNGSGTLQMYVDEEVFDITGDYNITNGKYKFVAYGIVNRDFEIQNGSSITFVGDIYDTDLDIDAIYKTKATLGTLIGDSTAVSSRRTVECKIKITDKMMNPRLQFGIEIPEIDPIIKSRVESALSTEDKVQKQFLSLLISNNFLPDEQSGIVNNSTMLYSNVSEVMASQLNNILEKLDIPVDVGLNYQPNDKGNDVFDVAVSTQMFNNRGVVNGSVGNKQYTENAQTDVVGDLDIEIKLNKSGALRLNLFSHSADSYTNYLDNSQRNGVGLTYQTEFSTLKQFIKNIFSSKKKRQEAQIAEEDAKADEERTVLKIE